MFLCVNAYCMNSVYKLNVNMNVTCYCVFDRSRIAGSPALGVFGSGLTNEAWSNAGPGMHGHHNKAGPIRK